MAAQAQLNVLESSVVATDIIITGIPQTANECLPELFTKICRVAEHKAPAIRDVFRLRNGGGNNQQNNNKATPIVVKLYSAPDRNMLLKSVAVCCKARKRSLALADIDLPGYGSFFLHESLPKKLRLVMAHASALRRQKQLASVFSIRGRVYVRVKAGEDAKEVCSIAEVNAVMEKERTSS